MNSNRALVIACITAAVVLVLLLIPGVLVYPGQDAVVAKDMAALTGAARETNKELRRQISGLEEVLQTGVCVDEGQLVPMESGKLSADAQSALPSPAPARVAPQAGALPDANASVGSVGDLIDAATVVVVQVDEDGNASMGTGFFVAPGRVVTNAHVVGGANDSPVAIFSKSIGKLDARVVAKGTPRDQGGTDLAVLEVNAPPDTPFLSFSDAVRGSEVIAAGFPGIVTSSDPENIKALQSGGASSPITAPFVDRGVLGQVQRESDGNLWLYHTAFIDKGNSGGALLDTCGRAVGVNTLVVTRGQDSQPTYARLGKAYSRESVLEFFKAHSIEPPRTVTERCAGS